jgi:hypothetical protein
VQNNDLVEIADALGIRVVYIVWNYYTMDYKIKWKQKPFSLVT